MALALAALWPGCSGRYGDLCAEARDCAEASDEDEAACVAMLEGYEDLASLYECDAEWDELITCFEEHNECDNDQRELEIDKQACDDESDDLERCFDDDKETVVVATTSSAGGSTSSGPVAPSTASAGGSGGAGGGI